MDHIKATEKKQAEDAMYDTFSRLQSEKSCETQPARDVHFKLMSGAVPTNDLTNGVDTSLKKTTYANQEPQDCKEDDELEPEQPPPRKVVYTTFRHTPRLFKTPSRESTAKREQEFIFKNRSNLKKNVLLNDVDIGDVNPVWLNSKGDEFYSKGDFCSAINAYSEALEADETIIHTLGNRAACYLHLREGSGCIKDCLAALKMNDAIESQFDTLLDQTQFRKKTHIRLAMAYCLNDEYSNGMEHFTNARHLDGTDGVAMESIRYLETLMEATQWKSKADGSFAEGDLIKAMESYTKALSIDPTLAKALMNRAACHLAMESSTGCIDDCTHALKLVSPGKPKKQDSCLIAAILFPKPSVQRKWIVTLLCRREARITIRRHDDIDLVAVEKSISCLKEEMV